jgi:polysaccharide pyruvyl transferase CsaB
MQKGKLKNSLIFIILPLLLPGLLVAAWRCLFRGMAEEKNIFVETVIDFEEMRQLSRDEGWKLNELFAAMREHGASSVAISEDTLASLESEGRITVLSSKEIRKLSIDEGLQQELPPGADGPGSLWVHSEDSALLDRIERHLSWKIPSNKLFRLHRNFLVINKSAYGFKERVGLGFSNEYFELARKADLGIVVRVFNYPGLTVASATRMISALPSPASVSALLFAEEEMLGNRGELSGIIELFKDRSYRIGWIEFNTQEGIGQYLKGLSRSRPFVRVHSISRKEIDQIYNVNRAIGRWVRSVKDRSMKMLYIRCFFRDDQKYIADLVKFNLKYLQRIENSLNRAGFVVAANSDQRINEPRHLVGKLSAPEKIAIVLALLLAFPLLIKLSFYEDLDNKWFFATALLAVGGYFYLPAQQLNAFAGVIGAFSYSSLGVVLAFSAIKKNDGLSGLFDLGRYFASLVLPSVLGGILIAGLHSEIEYLLKFEQFRGVKLAFVLPVLWVFLYSLKEFGKGFVDLVNRPLTPIMAIVGGAVFLGFIAYILRSGNLTIVKPSALEDSFRTFLENTLVARPRNKEFLVGYPAAALFVFFYLRRCTAILPILSIFVVMGQVSVLNTFCHFHSPLSLTILRVFNGFWLGLLVSLPVLAVAALVWLVILAGSEKKNSLLVAGYLGFGNFGDELLWQTFCEQMKTRLPELRLAVILGKDSRIPDFMADKVESISRSCRFRILEELLSCKALVFPGGGVLQSATSFSSLVYYSLLIFIARSAGAKILLPAQGFGPWGENIEKHSRFFRYLHNTLESADYISVRDQNSLDALNEVGDFNHIPITADLAFLARSGVNARIYAPEGALRVSIVLRKSVAESESIAKSFIQIAEEVENLQINPVALQPGDEEVWKNAGWTKDIVSFDGKNPVEALLDCDLVVSMRLHGCIVATIEAIPWIGIAYDPKVSGFARSCNWKFCYEPEKVDRKLIEEKLNVLAVKKIEYSQKLARRANEFSRRSQADFEAILSAISHNS